MDGVATTTATACNCMSAANQLAATAYAAHAAASKRGHRHGQRQLQRGQCMSTRSARVQRCAPMMITTPLLQLLLLPALLIFLCVMHASAARIDPRDEFNGHQVIEPIVRRTEDGERIALSALQLPSQCIDQLYLTIGDTHNIRLQRNRALLGGKYFEQHQHQDGRKIITTPDVEQRQVS